MRVDNCKTVKLKKASLQVLIRENWPRRRLSTVHDALRGPTGSRTLEISHAWLKRSNFAESSTWSLGIFLIIDFFFPFFSVYVILDKLSQYFLLVHVLEPKRSHVTNFIVGLEHASLNKGSWMNIFSIEHNKLLLLVAVLFEHVHFHFEVLFVEGLIGGEVTLCIEWDGFGVFEVLLLWRGDFFRRRLGFFVGGLDFEHFDWV